MNLHESLGGWPVVEDNKWNETSWTWQNVVKELNKLGWNNFLFSISIEMDPFRTTNNVIMVCMAHKYGCDFY